MGRTSPWKRPPESRISVPYELADSEQTKALAEIWSMLTQAGLDLSDLAVILKRSEMSLLFQAKSNFPVGTPQLYRLYSTPVAASYEVVSLSDADAGGFEEIDLNDLFVKAPERTIFLKVIGNSMIDEGIYPGSILSVETPDTTPSKSWLRIENGAIVVALIDRAYLTVKRFRRTDKEEFLDPRNRNNKHCEPILIGNQRHKSTEGHEAEILGIVRSVTQVFQ